MTDVCTEWCALERDLVSAYMAGAGFRAVRARFGIGYCQARNILRRNRIAIRGGGRRPSVPVDVQQRMCEMFEAGTSKAKIARETGWTTGAVIRALQRRERGRR